MSNNTIWTQPFSTKTNPAPYELIEISGLSNDGTIILLGRVSKLTPEIMNYYTRMAERRHNIQKIVAVTEGTLMQHLNHMYDAIQKKWLETSGTSNTVMVSGNSMFSFQETLRMGQSPQQRHSLPVQQGVVLPGPPTK